MTTESIRVDSSVLQKALAQKPNNLNKTAFLSQLIEKAVDSTNTLSGPPGHYSYSSSSNSLEELQRGTFLTPVEDHKAFLKETKKVAEKDSPAFQVFWEVYQASPSRAHNQSKSKARIAWREALKTERAENLIEAAKRAVKDQASKIGKDVWCAPFPDCHRWLRDECFSLWLEDITVEQPQEIIPGVTVL